MGNLGSKQKGKGAVMGLSQHAKAVAEAFADSLPEVRTGERVLIVMLPDVWRRDMKDAVATRLSRELWKRHRAQIRLVRPQDISASLIVESVTESGELRQE